MTSVRSLPESSPRPRVLVVSTYLAPCKEVGGKRFTFLSRYLSKWCDDYHVLARLERTEIIDETAFRGKVHRVRMFPHYPPVRAALRGVRNLIMQAWARWLCLVDPGVGFVIPATVRGIHLCKKHQLSVVIVSVPDFSSIIAATIISKIAGARLIIDYRDPWTNQLTEYPRPFGKRLSMFLERAGIKQASAIVFCSDIMRDEFYLSFGDIAPRCTSVIYNGFEDYEKPSRVRSHAGQITMLYAGNFHGRRRLSVIAPVLAQMHADGEISSEGFRWHIYSQLPGEDHALIDRLGLSTLIEVHEPVPYHEIKKVMSASDILFLPSGDEVAYAVPFKFFDYLSVRRPILAVAPEGSSVDQLMQQIDCGEFAKFSHKNDIRRAIRMLIGQENQPTFVGSEDFRWENAAMKYRHVIEAVLDVPARSHLVAEFD